ncbi:MAG TPA: energy transducer TonB [Bryobacteraceae bacterium]|jgi:TonB family protein
MRCADINLAAVILVASASLCPAQSASNSRALLESIAASRHEARAWRAEGNETGELTGEGINLHTQMTFRAIFRDRSHALWETSGDTRTLSVCDGVDHWTFAEPGTGFHREPAKVSPCSSQLPTFEDLLYNMVSATSAGVDHISFEGAPRECQIIRAEYRIPAPTENPAVGGKAPPAGTTLIRTVCVDPARKLILRDRTESWATGANTRFIRTVTFSSYQLDIEVPDSAFRFEVPTGTFLDPGPQLAEGDPGSSGVSRPRLIQKVDQAWTDEARQAGISGIVLVSLTVDPEGNPEHIAVTRGLGYGLDEKALEAVRQWRFSPGLKDGVPATANLTVAVDFHQP